MAVGMTANEYISKLNKDNPTIDSSSVKYINNRTRISVSCKVCGHKWTPVAGTLVGVNKTGCHPCGIKNRKTRSHITADEWWGISGGRTAEQQQALYKKKRSNADGVTDLSSHQTGKAIDIYPRITSI